MRKTVHWASLALLPAAFSAAAVTPDTYFGVAVTKTTLSAQGLPDFKPLGATAKFGAGLHRHFAVEAHAGLTEDESKAVEGTPVSAEINYFVSLFARGNLPLDRVTLYALLGVTFAEAEFRAPGLSTKEEENDLSYGLGIELYGNKTTALHVEAVRYLDQDNAEMESFNAGFVHHF